MKADNVHREYGYSDAPVYDAIVNWERANPSKSVPQYLVDTLHDQLNRLNGGDEGDMSDNDRIFRGSDALDSHLLDLTARVAKLETQISSSDSQQAEFRREVKEELKEFMNTVESLRSMIVDNFSKHANLLSVHIDQENKDRIKLLLLMITTLASSLISIAIGAGPALLEHFVASVKVVP